MPLSLTLREQQKSSIINAITGQNLAIVSDIKGTTTDPVLKAMELLPLGPVVLIDTPGLDDEGELGELRIKKAYQILNKTDIALLVVDSSIGMTIEDEKILSRIQKLDDEGELGELRIKKAYQILNKTDIALLVVDSSIGMTIEDEKILSRIQNKNIPYLIVYNKCDIFAEAASQSDNTISVSASTGTHIHELKEWIAALAPKSADSLPIVRDLLKSNDFVVLVVPIDSSAPKGRLILPQQQTIRDILEAGAVSVVVKDTELKETDFVVLVVPIDSSAPKGRLILPQQQTIRDILEAGAVSVVVKDTELKETLNNLGKKPALVITDSQAFKEVAKIVPEDIPLTSFSILFARHKGDLDIVANGTHAIEQLKDGDTILISEGCTHHRQCEDIGTVKIPRLLKNYTQADLNLAHAIEQLKDGDTILISEGCTHHRQCEDIGTVKIPRLLKNYTQADLNLEFTSGTEFPEDLSKYSLIIHCGGCTLNEREMKYRLRCAKDQNVPITNYGTAIAHMNGILRRSLEPFA